MQLLLSCMVFISGIFLLLWGTIYSLYIAHTFMTDKKLSLSLVWFWIATLLGLVTIDFITIAYKTLFFN